MSRKPSRWKKGTRALRLRTVVRTGKVPGQPSAPVTGHGAGPSGPEEHYCGECFGRRNRYRAGPFCSNCEQELFGSPRLGFLSFVRSERARMRYVRARWAAAGYIPPDHSKEPKEGNQ